MDFDNKTIKTTRLFNYPQSLVFKAWTDPDHLKNWWGPKGFTNTFLAFDLKPGGDWKFIMHGPDGKDFENHSVFVEIDPEERIVFDHLGWHKFRVITTFENQDQKTLVTFRQIFETEEMCEKSKPYGIPANEENFDRLEEELGRMVLIMGSF